MSEFNKGYYRREGRKVGIFEERVRIIKMLKEIISEREKVEQTTWVQNEISNLLYLIKLIERGTDA